MQLSFNIVDRTNPEGRTRVKKIHWWVRKMGITIAEGFCDSKFEAEAEMEKLQEKENQNEHGLPQVPVRSEM
jgi:hypothetical protein